ncbi:MAG: phosphoserine phosphatase SerB [Actinomycetes bacterium]
MSEPRTLLVTLTGRDHPGVTSALFGAMAAYGVEVLDVEQVVIRGRLVLGTLVTAPADEDGLRAAVDRVAVDQGLDVEVAAGRGDSRPRPSGRVHVNVLGYPLRPDAMSGLAGLVADCGGNIDRIMRLARYPVTCIEMDVSGAEPTALRASLAVGAAELGVDLAVAPAGLHRRAKRLVVLDVDSTLVQGEVIEMLAARAGHAEEVAQVTAEAMAGELDFAESLRQRVALLAGLEASVVHEVRADLQLAAGARTLVRTLKRLGYQIAIVSGGFTQVTDALAAELGIHYAAANTLDVEDGRLTGRLVGPLLDRAGKADALARFADEAGVPMGLTVAIGDGANDLDMLTRAGLGVAFNAKPVVREAADTSVNVPYLDAILYLLGVTREEVEAADAEDGPSRPTPSSPQQGGS